MPSFRIQGYDQDLLLAKCGRPVDLGRNKDGTMRRIFVRPFGFAYETRLAALRKASGERACQRDAELDRECQIKAMAEHILSRKGADGTDHPAWENIQDETGKPIEPTPENKMNALRGGFKGEDPNTFSRQFMLDVATAAASDATFQREEREELEKNSSSASPGT